MTIVNGQTPDADEVIQITKIEEVYTSTGFDSTRSAAGNDEQDHELTAITASKLVDATYLVIKMVVVADIYQPGGDSFVRCHPQVKIQTKAIGGAYGDSMTYKDLANIRSAAGHVGSKNLVNLTWVHTLTQDEIDDGVQVKVFSKSLIDDDGAGSASFTCSVTNIQTTIEVKP